MKIKGEKLHFIAEIVLITSVIICSVAGILSVNFESYFMHMNDFNEVIKMYGYGVYSHDSFFKSPLFIGADLNALIFFTPLYIHFLYSFRRYGGNVRRLRLMAAECVTLYSGASSCFGVRYNSLFPLYLLIFSISIFSVGFHIKKMKALPPVELSRSLSVFLILAGSSVLIAWMPDVLKDTLMNTKPEYLEVYTTEVTNILDLGIMGPLSFICFNLLRKKDGDGTILLSPILLIMGFVGTMMITQGIMQYASGVRIPLGVLITKVIIFLALGIFAYILWKKIFKELMKEDTSHDYESMMTNH